MDPQPSFAAPVGLHFRPLDVPLEQKPLDFQVQYLTQIFVLQQQMIRSETEMHVSFASQSKQLQEIAASTLLAANQRIQSLEENLQTQASVLEGENALLKVQVDQMQAIHKVVWKALVQATAAKVGNIVFKINFVLQGLEAFKEKRKLKAGLFAERRKFQKLREECETDEEFFKTPGYDDFVKRYLQLYDVRTSTHTFPYICTKDLAISEAEYEATNFYCTLIRKNAHEPLDTINWEGIKEHPAYTSTMTGKPLESIESNAEIQQLFEVLKDDTLAKLKISNAALKVLKDDMQACHAALINDFPLHIHNKYIKPCLNHIENYIQGISEFKRLYFAELHPVQTDYDRIISSHHLAQFECIKLQLEELKVNIQT